MYRIAVASFSHETCTFCPNITTLEAWEAGGMDYGEDALDYTGRGRSYVTGYKEVAEGHDDVELVGILRPGSPRTVGMGSWLTTEAFDVITGRIVDGIGGTAASFGTRATGCLDAELAHILHFRSKGEIYTGGLVDVAGLPLDILERDICRELEERPRIALERLLESLSSDAAAISWRTGVRSCILSSVLGPGLNELITARLRDSGMEILQPVDGSKSAATGAAYLANGLIQGRYRGLVESLRIADSAGSVLDDIYLKARPREV